MSWDLYLVFQPQIKQFLLRWVLLHFCTTPGSSANFNLRVTRYLLAFKNASKPSQMFEYYSCDFWMDRKVKSDTEVSYRVDIHYSPTKVEGIVLDHFKCLELWRSTVKCKCTLSNDIKKWIEMKHPKYVYIEDFSNSFERIALAQYFDRLCQFLVATLSKNFFHRN